ncbi:HAMP domain-containing sensor histidine kinase [Streptomyces sp. NPDC097619]|uniref:sensor histidine kinase n=1 Tax=Streptomyces sp. NPDC097619 TaxID=3157228 RepID=UPI00331E80D8
MAEAAGLGIAVMDPSGTLRGPAAAAVSTAQRDRLLTGRPLSAEGTLDGRRVLVEGWTGRGGAVVLTRSTAEVDAAASRLRRNLLLPLGAGLAGAALAGWFLARRLARPLTRAAELARSLARTRTRSGTRTENGSMSGTTYGDGSGRVPEHPHALPEPPPTHPAPGPATTTDRGPAEVAELHRALLLLDEALERSEDRQRVFLMSVSHEIRTPLTTLSGYAEALSDGVIPADRVPATGALMLREAGRLDRFLRDLLDLARLEAVDFRLDPGPTDLAALVGSAAETWRDRCARRGVVLRLERPEPPVAMTVRTDGFRVRQLLDCLLENALRVTPEGAPVVLAVASRAPSAGGGAVLQVRDGGPGLTEEDVAVAFERGALHDRYRGLRPGGSGLGLALAHRLAGRLGAVLTLTGHGPEGGAAFTLTVPAELPTDLPGDLPDPPRGTAVR